MEHRSHVSYFRIAHLLQGIHFQHFIKVPRCLTFWVKHLFSWFSTEVMIRFCNFICLYLWNFKHHCWMHREEEPNSQILPIEVSAGWRMLNCITQHFFCPCTWRGKNKQMGIRLLGCDGSPSSPWMNAAPLCASEALPYASNQPREGHGKGQRWGI